MALSKIQAESMNLADTYAFTGTVSGVGVGNVKAWVNFDGTGTVSIRGSGNVSSITDNGTGYYIVNFTTSITDANYCVVVDSGIGGYRANTDILGSGNQTVSSSQVITSSTQDAVMRDAVIVSLVVLR
jgi:hypothetical protein